jgi:hypothetical protein
MPFVRFAKIITKTFKNKALNLQGGKLFEDF